jgi:hypothetical protein
VAPPALAPLVVAPPAVAPPPFPPIDASAAAAAAVTRAGSWFAGLDPRGWRTTLVAAALMIGVVAGVNIVNAAVPLPTDFGPVDPGPVVPGGPTLEPGEPTPMPVDPGPVQPGTGLEVGAGIVVYPPDGWTVVGSESGQVAIQKAGAVMVIIGIPWTASPADLATAYRDEFFTTGQFTAAEPESGEVGNGIPAVALSYTGVLEGTQVDGAIFAGATGGSGVVANVFAAKGGLQGLGGDVDALLSSIQVTGGGQ